MKDICDLFVRPAPVAEPREPAIFNPTSAGRVARDCIELLAAGRHLLYHLATTATVIELFSL
jgi:hypothetical protein